MRVFVVYKKIYTSYNNYALVHHVRKIYNFTDTLFETASTITYNTVKDYANLKNIITA